MDNFPFKLPMILDGATGTNLIQAGMPQGVCVEDWIVKNPQHIQRIQKEFIKNGSQAVYAPTFGANSLKLKHFGLEDKAEELNTALVQISKEAVGEKALVAGDLSPTGVFAEPFGEYSYTELVDCYRKQATALKKAGVDFFVIETMMSLSEARAAVLACRGFDLPVFVTMTVDEKGNTLSGSSALGCLVVLQELGISAFGLNCSFGPEKMAKVISEIAPYAKVPLIAKPNAGQPSATNPNEFELSPSEMAEGIKLLLKAGAKIVGGCCGNTPEHIKAISQAVNSFDFSSVETEKVSKEIILANHRQVFGFSSENIDFSPEIKCETDMADELLDLEYENYDVVSVAVNTPEDAKLFSLNAHLVNLPVAFLSNDEVSLKSALFLYNGLAMVDSKSTIDKEVLEEIARKYGAVIY